MAISPNTDFTSGQILTATQQNQFPRGVMAYAQSSTADTTITTEEVQLTSTAFTAVANRYYKITYFEPQCYSPTSACIIQAAIRKGTTTAGTQLVQSAISVGAGTQYAPLNPSVITTLTAGSQQVCATLSFSAGTGQTTRSGVEYAYLLVEDIGPA